jgi:glycosyltransferase involved in cell wall biosynthesis
MTTRTSNNSTNTINSIYLSIVIPVYNEEENVEILFRELGTAIDPLEKPYEIIFVDDGSSDSTIECLTKVIEEEKQEKNKGRKIRLIRFSRNFGQTAAMQAGFDFARGEVIVSLDGDLQNDPGDIPKLLKTLNQGYDVVCGWRKDRKDKFLTRILPSKVANWLIAKITGVPIHDIGCSFKAYRSKIIKSIRLYSDMHRFIPAVTTMADARIAEVVVSHRRRKFGEGKYGLSRIWKVLSDIVTITMIIHFHNQPILWFALLGLIFAGFGIGFGILSIVTFLQGVQTIVYPAASFLFLSLFASLVSWGLLAESLIRHEKNGVSVKTDK